MDYASLMYYFVQMVFMMFVGHAVCDYALQSDFIAAAKNPNTDVGKTFWTHVLTAHALIHAGAVYWITQSLTLGLLEFALHWVTDLLKCNNRISLQMDQSIHYWSKVLWAAITVIWLWPIFVIA